MFKQMLHYFPLNNCREQMIRYLGVQNTINIPLVAVRGVTLTHHPRSHFPRP